MRNYMNTKSQKYRVKTYPNIKWYIVHAYSGKELVVMSNLTEIAVKLHKMEDKFGEIIVPTEEVVEMRGGQKCRSKRKFFPGYVLVQMEMNDQTWHLVRNTYHGLWVLLVVPVINQRAS